MQDTPSSFIVYKAFCWHFAHMRRLFS
ncbi:MAG: hypothetical protein RLZZ604_464, partial [Pseudomonadota bacterium]